MKSDKNLYYKPQGNDKFISIRNARVHNLKGIDLDIPRNKFVVITGLSGSGKSSLAFDTLYAEGQRRYVESLSSYVRQFLGRMNKPEVDKIAGIPPAIAIEQKVINNNPRSTVGTVTEIYEYLKLLYTRIGKTYSPISGREVKRHTVDDVIAYIMALPEGMAAVVAVELNPAVNDIAGQADKASFLRDYLQRLSQRGFSRLFVDNEFVRINDVVEKKDKSLVAAFDSICLVIDRVTVSDDKEIVNRLYDSIESAFDEGNGRCLVLHDDISGKKKKTHARFSKFFEADGMVFSEPTDKMFAFNSPVGACPTCGGFGKTVGIDPDLVIPDRSLSIYEDAVMPWRGQVLGEAKRDLIYNAEKFKFPIHKPYYQLSEVQKQLLWSGNAYFKGLTQMFKEIEAQRYKMQYRVMLSRYSGKTTCPDCGGTRLKREAEYVKIAGRSITELVNVSINELYDFVSSLELTEYEQQVSKRLVNEILSRLGFLMDVGLGYLTLNRQSNTLSGGESQRINLATSLGSALVGSLYILDEPSIGLHPRDTQRLIKVLHRLRDLGNTVIVVEHDEEIMRAADYIVDIGPEAGRRGGEVMFIAPIDKLSEVQNPKSYTLAYLNGTRKIELPQSRRKSSNFIEILGASQNNLKCIDVKFPLGIMTAVTGVSGSGKSSLVRDVLYPALRNHFDDIARDTVHYGSLRGSLHLIGGVELVDQNPIGKSSRSNPVTYLKAFDEIRKLFAEQPLSTQMGYTAAHFSFNVDGGRCPVCQGEGTVTVPMQFMADLNLPCEACHGKRFKNDILEVRYHGANINDVLEMTVNQAIEFFELHTNTTAKKIVKRLKPLQEVGIGYIRLGQSSSTLSGGETQRVKLAYYLSLETKEHMFFIFDEPTTGLHIHDINILMAAFNALIRRGHTVLVIEHNLDVIKCADYIIDIGPEGGAAGGTIVAAGTPEIIASCEKSYTGQALKPYLKP